MIRTAWVAVNVILSTLFFGAVAIGASLLRVRRAPFYAWLTQQWSRSILWASGTPVVVHGRGRVDWSEPQVLVSNHVSDYDVLALADAVPPPFSFVAKKELERIPVFGRAWKAAGHISIDRSDRYSAVESLRRAGEMVRRERGTVIIFPEGTRSRSGRLLPFKKGAFALATEARLGIIPVIIRGSDAILKPGSLRIRPHPIHVMFGDPIRPDHFPQGGAEALMAAVHARMLQLEATSGEALPTGVRSAG